MTRNALIISLALISSCATYTKPPLADPNIPRAQDLFIEVCQKQNSDTVICQRPGFVKALNEVTDLWGAAMTWKVLCEECRQVNLVDLAVAQGRIETCEADLESARTWKWIFGAIGLAAGSIVTALAVSAK